MSTYRFAPGEHDANICGHILIGQTLEGPVEHTEHDDGSVEVDFPGVSEDAIAIAIASYDPIVAAMPILTVPDATAVAAMPPLSGTLGTIQTILAKDDADVTASEIKTLVLVMARYLLRSWVNDWQ